MDVVVVGHGTAGQTAAAVVKKVSPDAQVTVLEKHNYVAYHPCSLPAVLGGKLRLEDVIERVPKGKVRVITGATAKLVDQEAKEVIFERDGSTDSLPYDKVILATGLKPSFPPVEGLQLEGVGTVWDVESVESLLKFLGNKVVVVGGSATGIEVAAELASTGRDVTLIEMMEQLMPGKVDPPIASTVAKHLKDMGVKVHLKTALQELRGEGGKLKEVVTNRGTFEAETAIVVTGAKPNVDLAKRSGLPLGKSGVKVDEYLYSTEHVLAAGDVAEVKDFVTGRPITTGLASTALVQGRIAGENVVGRVIKYRGALSPYVVKVGEFSFGGVGISATQASRLGMKYLSFRFSGFDLPRYMPEKRRVFVWLVTTPDGKLIGAQLFGRRIRQHLTFLTAAIYAGFRVQDIRLMEFAYQPEIIDVVDPVASAAEGISRKYRLITSQSPTY